VLLGQAHTGVGIQTLFILSIYFHLPVQLGRRIDIIHRIIIHSHRRWWLSVLLETCPVNHPFILKLHPYSFACGIV
jgi:hypothetical protein